MNKLKKGYVYVKRQYDTLTVKRYTTISGTLVFFLILSIVPLTFWLTLLLGKLPIDVENIFELAAFEPVRKILGYIRAEAEKATTSASVFLLLTTLYSSTTLFYQMRRSGELIYECNQKPKGLLTRVRALFLVFFLLLAALVFALLFAVGSYVFSKVFSPLVQAFTTYLLLFALSFFLVWLLNVYVCPYKIKARKFLGGTFITVATWTVAMIGFGIYLRIGNLGKLYGALNAIIVFLLWLYVLMICFIIGVIFNSEKIVVRKRVAKPI
jgi:membrane protein